MRTPAKSAGVLPGQREEATAALAWSAAGHFAGLIFGGAAVAGGVAGGAPSAAGAGLRTTRSPGFTTASAFGAGGGSFGVVWVVSAAGAVVDCVSAVGSFFPQPASVEDAPTITNAAAKNFSRSSFIFRFLSIPGGGREHARVVEGESFVPHQLYDFVALASNHDDI